MPGRSSVHRCPSRFTFRTDSLIGFFAAFFTAMNSPPRTLLDTLLLSKVQSDFS
jgi:hypothetical protein